MAESDEKMTPRTQEKLWLNAINDIPPDLISSRVLNYIDSIEPGKGEGIELEWKWKMIKENVTITTLTIFQQDPGLDTEQPPKWPPDCTDEIRLEELDPLPPIIRRPPLVHMNESFVVPDDQSLFDPSQLPDSDATMKGTSSDEDAIFGSPSKQAKLDNAFKTIIDSGIVDVGSMESSTVIELESGFASTGISTRKIKTSQSSEELASLSRRQPAVVRQSDDRRLQSDDRRLQSVTGLPIPRRSSSINNRLAAFGTSVVASVASHLRVPAATGGSNRSQSVSRQSNDPNVSSTGSVASKQLGALKAGEQSCPDLLRTTSGCGDGSKNSNASGIPRGLHRSQTFVINRPPSGALKSAIPVIGRHDLRAASASRASKENLGHLPQVATTGTLKTQSTPNKVNPVAARNPNRTFDKSDATFSRNVAEVGGTPDFAQQAPLQRANPAHTYSVERPQQPVSRIAKRSKDGLLPRRQLVQTKDQ